MRRLIDSLRVESDKAGELLQRAERAGMEVSQAEFDLNGARDDLVKARAAVHAFKVDAVKQAVELGPVEKREIGPLGLEVGDERVEVPFFPARGLAHVVGDAALLQEVEDVGTAVHAAGLERVLFLGEIEERDVLEGHVVEVEVALEAKQALDRLGEDVPHPPATGDEARYPAQRRQAAEWRVLRIIDKIAPVAVRGRPGAGEDGGDASGAVAEDGAQRTAMRRDVFHEGIVADDFPAAGIDKQKQGEAFFHKIGSSVSRRKAWSSVIGAPPRKRFNSAASRPRSSVALRPRPMFARSHEIRRAAP